MRLFVAALNAETNFWSPIPTGLGAFVFRTAQAPDAGGFSNTLAAVRDAADAYGWGVIEGPCASAQPLGPLTADAWATVRGMVLAALKAALPVQAVVLVLHGAMSAEDCDDCEGALIADARALVGAEIPIGVELDPHCHLTDQMCREANVIVAYKEYPHTDIAEQAGRLTTLTVRTARGEIRPVIGVADCPVMGLLPTTRAPMSGFVQRMRDAEGQGEALSVSFGHGFAYADVPEAGARAWVVADGDGALAQRLARAFAEDLYRLRDQVALRFTPLATAVEAAIGWSGPCALILADVADNPGGGARADSTFILEALLEKRIGAVALGGVWDPGAVQICLEAGVGARLSLRLGGKSGPTAGAPLDVVGRVMGVREAHMQTEFGVAGPLGAAAWLRTETGIDIALISRCQQVLGRDLFTGLGITLEDKRVIVVKSMQHFLADFSGLIGEVMYVDTPGLLRTDFENIPFKRRSLDFWPRLPDPLALSGGA